MKKLLILTLLIVGVYVSTTQLKPKIETHIQITKAEKQNEKAKQMVDGANILEVPFICQAPLQTEANWKYHEESCEEAAVLQTYLYETGKTMTKEEANEEILKMIEWQKVNFGGHKDIYAAEVKELINGYYQIPNEDIEIVLDATIADIKKEILQGHPVIVPITGDILNNPYYPYPGYHMLVVTGFTEEFIITNDNGTKRGEDFSYKTEIFEKAMNDAGGDIIVIKLNNQ